MWSHYLLKQKLRLYQGKNGKPFDKCFIQWSKAIHALFFNLLNSERRKIHIFVILKILGAREEFIGGYCLTSHCWHGNSRGLQRSIFCLPL